MPCDAACQKIIIDTGGNQGGGGRWMSGRLGRVAKLYADTADAFGQAFHNVRTERAIEGEELDKLHALSELDCHRAGQIMYWIEELHLRTVSLAGGEYEGGFEVHGIENVTKKAPKPEPQSEPGA